MGQSCENVAVRKVRHKELTNVMVFTTCIYSQYNHNRNPRAFKITGPN